MAFFTSNPYPQPKVVDETRMMLMEQAKVEMGGFAMMFNMVNTHCDHKCLSLKNIDQKNIDDNLTNNEHACLDRCVVKMMEAQNFVAQVMQKRAETQMQGMMAPPASPPPQSQ